MGSYLVGDALMGSCPSGELSWWGIASWGVTLAGSCPGGKLSWWEVVLVGSPPVGELSQWGIVLVGSHPGESCLGGTCPVGSFPRTIRRHEPQ